MKPSVFFYALKNSSISIDYSDKITSISMYAEKGCIYIESAEGRHRMKIKAGTCFTISRKKTKFLTGLVISGDIATLILTAQ